MNKLKEELSKLSAAIKTLENLNYTYHGAELWKPPLCNIGVETKPVFTQSMVDEGVLPSVGMECLVYDIESQEYIKGLVLMHHKESIVFDIDGWDSAFVFGNSHSFKPLTPPKTDEEKLKYEFECAIHDALGDHTAEDYSSVEGIADELLCKFNIKLLEVKDND